MDKAFGCVSVLVGADEKHDEFEFGVVICLDCRPSFDDRYPLDLFERSTPHFEATDAVSREEASEMLSQGVLVGPHCVRCGADSGLR